MDSILPPMSSSPVTALGLLPSSCPILQTGVRDIINVTKNIKLIMKKNIKSAGYKGMRNGNFNCR
ncbi:uncharacterized protein TOL2_C14230 [Desulfobacula toluolica Tol2]|uniref:Uncharacterized protein n=1 Tax=Desulfobacula toluolica (strain DSM 7467 / Tol2) TaxID=651182 RepID=K0NES3_DESTT|nr:uncharacterized protein TOL2_C14230 [Desulfobacula toluolica Tol2]